MVTQRRGHRWETHYLSFLCKNKKQVSIFQYCGTFTILTTRSLCITLLCMCLSIVVNNWVYILMNGSLCKCPVLHMGAWVNIVIGSLCKCLGLHMCNCLGLHIDDWVSLQMPGYTSYCLGLPIYAYVIYFYPCSVLCN